MRYVVFIGILAWGTAVWADRDLSVTVYNQDFGVVKDARSFVAPKGLGVLTFSDIAARIDPTTVQITNPGNPQFSVREQNFENNLVSAEALMARMVDQPVTAMLADGTCFQGKLLSTERSAVTLGTAEGVKIVPRGESFAQVVLPRLPEGLLLRPTLVWRTAGGTGGSETIQVAYQTAGMNWSADYNALVRPEVRKLDLNGWVTITNQSGTAYPDSGLKLVAGEVHKVKPEPEMPRMAGVELNMLAKAPEQPPPGFAERAFAEYHLYDLGRKTTLRNNETKQIQFINLWDIPYTIEYLFAAETMRDFRPRRFGAKPMEESGSQPLKVVATVENKKANGLGIPLPAGTVRMYQEDREKTDRLIGEDRIDHTPKDEKVRLTVGRAFDVVGQRTVESANQINPKTFTQNIRVQIRNHKPEPIMVVVKETLMGHLNWTVEQTSEAYQKIDFQTIEYRFNLAGNTEKTIRYRVRYDQTQW